MCTVTFIPTRNGFYLTSNRDEHESRSQAIVPQIYDNVGEQLIFPKDPDKKGSWIVGKSNGDIGVLLNGALQKHQVRERYRKSRGLILLDIIKAVSPTNAYQQIDLEEIEPFTLILFSLGELYECRWDGERKQITSLDAKRAYIWSSATLYDKMALAKRESWFGELRNSECSKSRETILNFHRYGGYGDPKDGLVINRDKQKIRTMSITNVCAIPGMISMVYNDLKDGNLYNCVLSTKTPLRDWPGIKSKNHFTGLRAFLIRLFSWEYWPYPVVYAPIMFYWFWLSIRARSLFFFNAANPLIEYGGFTMESKMSIYQLIPRKYHPKTILVKPHTSTGVIRELLMKGSFGYPLIAKPDIGCRGARVEIVYGEKELLEYSANIGVDFLIQQYISFKQEAGIFYYRYPGESKGHISGIVGKEFLTVIGDGISTIEKLLTNEPRYFLQLNALRKNSSDILASVPEAGVEKVLVPYGNHSRGAKFIDLSQRITKQLTDVIDKVCIEIPEFYFGRLDIMYNSWEELCRGENFSIIELNGSGSEPTHIYDPSHSIFFAWKEIIRHWHLLFQIGKLNKKRKGIPYLSFREGITLLKRNNAYFKSIA